MPCHRQYLPFSLPTVLIITLLVNHTGSSTLPTPGASGMCYSFCVAHPPPSRKKVKVFFVKVFFSSFSINFLFDFLAYILIEINVFVINKLSATRMTTAYVLVRVVEGDSKVAICDQFVHKILESDFNDNFHILFEKALAGENIEKFGGR